MIHPKSKDYDVVLHLTKNQYYKAIEYQESYETLFNKHLPLEDLFKIAAFFSLNINNQKIAILESYDNNKVNITDKTSDKTKNNHISKTNTNQSKPRRKKRVIPFKEPQVKQAKLGGFE
jgi:hypothetical protein